MSDLKELLGDVVDRRIGGLETSGQGRDPTVIVDRRIGGLERS